MQVEKRWIEFKEAQAKYWRESFLRRALAWAFLFSLLLYTAAVIFFAWPVSTDGNPSYCTLKETVSYSFASEVEIPEDKSRTVTCSERSVPPWLLVAGPSLSAVILAALVILNPDSSKVTIELPGGIRAELTSSAASAADHTKADAETFKAAEKRKKTGN
ncbi:hypothetical protein [Rathayibacter sp. AY1A7]|uniref:hypothetical protein n=1 Tax=Rathayibacter sp. AY1A7 TaxID=2080524 RepID=UPI0011B01A87|nr:hypothetical protein [Rathayibacter sp. AY1A7]